MRHRPELGTPTPKDDHEVKEEIQELWRLLALLPRIYEDVCREWYLPTGLGFAGSFQRSRRDDLALG